MSRSRDRSCNLYRGHRMASGDILVAYRKLYRKAGEEIESFRKHEVGSENRGQACLKPFVESSY